MSNLFQSSAKASSVESNTIKVENEAEGILREGQATLRKMGRRFNAEEAKAVRAEKYRQEKFNAEQENRKITRKWEMELSDSFIEAVKYNHKVEMDGLTSAVKNANKGLLGDLAQLSPTLGKLWDGIDQKREEDGKAFGRMLSFKYGITKEDYDASQSIRGHLRENAGNNYALINKMKEQGASWEDIDKASRLNGYQQLGLAEGTAINAGKNYEAWAWQKSTHDYELGNGLGTSSLSKAKSTGNLGLLQAVQQAMLTEYLEQPHLKSLDNDLLIQHTREPIIRSQGRQVSLLVEQNRELIQENEDRNYRQQIANAVNINGASGYFDEIKLLSGKNNENRAWAVAQSHKHLQKLFEEGVLSKKHLFDIYDYEFMPGVKYGERNHHKMKELILAVDKYDLAQRTRAETEMAAELTDQKIQSFRLEKEIVSNYDTVSNDEMMEMYKYAAQVGNDTMMKMLQRRMKTSVTTINDTANVPHLEKLLVNNMLTSEAVANANLSPIKEVEWMKKAKENNPFAPPDDIDKLFETTGKRAIEQILKTFGVESKYILSSSLASTTAHNDMRRYYKMGLMQSNGNKEAARDIALKMFQDDLKSEKYHVTERTMVNGTMTQNPHFTKFHLQPERISYPASQWTTEMVRQDPEIWQKKLMIPEQEIRTFIQDLNNGRVKGFPPTALHLSKKYGWDALKFIDAQGQLLDTNLKIDEKWFNVSTEANSRIRPEFRSMLNEGPMGVATAMTFSGLNAPNYTPTNDSSNATTMYRDRKYMSPMANDIFDTMEAWR